MINGLIKILSVSKPVQEMPAQQQQQPMFRARSPVSVLGGVIRLSAPYWHEQSMFILEQSVCLFIKGFDHSTPWPAGPNYPPCWSHPVHSISRPIREYPLFLCLFFSLLNCSSYSFSPSFASLSPTLSGAPSHCWVISCLTMVWFPG